jgi:DnaK suppressor protein
MDEIEKTELVDRIKKRKLEIESNLASLDESAKPVDLNAPIGRLSRMDAMQQQQMSLHAKKQAQLSLLQVEEAVKRLENGTYGFCLKCEGEIPTKRLIAKPEAPFCTRCQG